MLSVLLSFSALLVTFASVGYPTLLTADTIHDGSFSRYVGGFPTNNGTNAAILVNSAIQALTGQLHGDYWIFTGFNNKTYSFYMDPTAESAQFPPERYSY
ncbi:MAG: hypothetical protein Q9175_003838 [Cornicularia normoerica]